MFTVTIEASPCEVIMFSTILATFFFHKHLLLKKIQCADLNGINLPTRNTGTLRGKMQLLAMAICQIETTGIEPVSHDIQYHCSTTELCFFYRLSRTVLFKRTGMIFKFKLNISGISIICLISIETFWISCHELVYVHL